MAGGAGPAKGRDWDVGPYNGKGPGRGGGRGGGYRMGRSYGGGELERKGYNCNSGKRCDNVMNGSVAYG